MFARLSQLTRDSTLSTWTAGLLAVVISFAGPMLLVAEAARAGDLTAAQTESWIWALAIASGTVCLVLSLTMRVPVVAAWSIPGSVLLIDALQVYSFSAAVGTYLVVGVVSGTLGMTSWFPRMLAAIPRPITSGLLAGILLPFCLDAVQAGVSLPLIAVTMLVTFMAGRRLFPRLAVPSTLLIGLLGVLLTDRLGEPTTGVAEIHDVIATPTWTTPSFEVGALISLGLPLLLVTMVGQNLPGVALMRTLGYRFDARPALTSSGVASVAFAPFGAHAINLATVTGAVCAGPEAHPARRRRYVAGVSCGVWYLIFGTLTPLFLMLLAVVPTEVLTVMAGLALLGALLAALSDLLTSTSARQASGASVEAGLVALIITASGIDPLGLASPVWGALGGLVVHLISRPRRARAGRAPHRTDDEGPVKNTGRDGTANALHPTTAR